MRKIGDDVNSDFVRVRNALLKLQVSRKINEQAKREYLKMLHVEIGQAISGSCHELCNIWELARKAQKHNRSISIVFHGFNPGWGEVQYVNEAGDKSSRQFNDIDNLKEILESLVERPKEETK